MPRNAGKTPSTEIALNGLISSAGFLHGGEARNFGYTYLAGTNLLQVLTKPNDMTLKQSYEEKRDMLIGQLYKRSTSTVASRAYTYDALGRPVTRSTSKDGTTVNDSFGYNSRSELNTAMVNNEAYVYDYDNIGNRETVQEAAEDTTSYESNQLNQYTAIGDFVPTYDEAGNQTKVKTKTGIWSVVYNAENRPTSFTSAASGIIVECTYDYMGRRATKKVTVNGSVTLHQRFLYRGYLQIACCDLTRSQHPALWLITWDPSQTVATRPLAIQKDGTWYTYGRDLTKNICEVYGQHGYIRTNYSYSPYGEVTISGDVTQPIQWSSEFYDLETKLVYYNYRYYNEITGNWITRDFIPDEKNYFNYDYARRSPLLYFDYLGLKYYLCIYTNCCRKHGAVYDDGHAALALINTDNNSITTYGLWPDWHEDIVKAGLNDENASDVRINFPNDNISDYGYVHCREVSDKELEVFKREISENWTWRYTQTCASFASDVFYSTTNVDIDADDLFGFETPREIGDSILEANNAESNSSNQSSNNSTSN